MPTGTVKFYHTDRGYGFIIIDDNGTDIFVHHSEIQTADNTLKGGQKVEFEVGERPKGLCAVKVKLC